MTVIDYLRGDRSGEGTSFRKRLSLIGAVINSEPAVQRRENVIYVQSGEGMLHAIDTTSGDCRQRALGLRAAGGAADLGETTQRSYVFHTQLDGSPTVGTYAGGTLLVAGMGAAGAASMPWTCPAPRD
jgi:type IV pilus assembly protein PilY1